MPLIAICDICGCRVEENAAKDGVISTRGTLTVKTKILKAKKSDPIICEKCIRLCVQHQESPQNPPAKD